MSLTTRKKSEGRKIKKMPHLESLLSRFYMCTSKSVFVVILYCLVWWNKRNMVSSPSNFYIRTHVFSLWTSLGIPPIGQTHCFSYNHNPLRICTIYHSVPLHVGPCFAGLLRLPAVKALCLFKPFPNFLFDMYLQALALFTVMVLNEPIPAYSTLDTRQCTTWPRKSQISVINYSLIWIQIIYCTFVNGFLSHPCIL